MGLVTDTKMCDTFFPLMQAHYENYKVLAGPDFLFGLGNRDGGEVNIGDMVDRVGPWAWSAVGMTTLATRCGFDATSYIDDYTNINLNFESMWNDAAQIYSNIDSGGLFFDTATDLFATPLGVCSAVIAEIVPDARIDPIFNTLNTRYVDVFGYTSINIEHTCYTAQGTDNPLCTSGETWDGPVWDWADGNMCQASLRRRINTFGDSGLIPTYDARVADSFQLLGNVNPFGSESWNGNTGGRANWGGTPYTPVGFTITSDLNNFDIFSSLDFTLMAGACGDAFCGDTTCDVVCGETPANCETDCGPVLCGNAVIDPPEVCDVPDFGGENCISQGFDSGTLGCDVDCLGFDTSGCSFDAFVPFTDAEYISWFDVVNLDTNAGLGFSGSNSPSFWAWDNALIVEGQLNLYLKTGDSKYLDFVVANTDVLISKATVDPSGFLGWDDLEPGLDPILTYSRIVLPMVKFSYIVKKQGLGGYMSKADEYQSFVETNFVPVYNTFWSECGTLGFWGFPDKSDPNNRVSYVGRIHLYLYLITGDPFYLDRSNKYANKIRSTLLIRNDGPNAVNYYFWNYNNKAGCTTVNNAWVCSIDCPADTDDICNVDPGAWNCGGVLEIIYGAYDISLMVDYFRAGIVFNSVDMNLLANTYKEGLLLEEAEVSGVPTLDC